MALEKYAKFLKKVCKKSFEIMLGSLWKFLKGSLREYDWKSFISIKRIHEK
jgi:hypothetical protein